MSFEYGKGFAGPRYVDYFKLDSSCQHLNTCFSAIKLIYTGQQMTSRFIAYILLGYYRTDTLGPDRVNAEWNIAHKCNFIHPKIYYYDHPLTGDSGLFLVL